MPLFGTLIAYVEDHEPIIGVIHFPALQETVYAARGYGCWFKARHRVPVRIDVQNGVTLADAYVSASGVHNSDVTGDDAVENNLSAVIRSARKFRFCGDCGQYTLVCRGKIHAALDTVVNPWDIAALVPCVEEAGGVISSLSGDRQNVLYGGNVLASSDPALHAEILKCLRPGKPDM
jgi:histidinol-phosphatase